MYMYMRLLQPDQISHTQRKRGLTIQANVHTPRCEKVKTKNADVQV